MDIAALIAWVIAAPGGFSVLGTRIARGGARGGTGHVRGTVAAVVLVPLTVPGVGG